MLASLGQSMGRRVFNGGRVGGERKAVPEEGALILASTPESSSVV